MDRSLESTAGHVVADIERMRLNNVVDDDAPVLVLFLDRSRLFTLRDDVRRRIEADGLTDEDVDTMIEEARTSAHQNLSKNA